MTTSAALDGREAEVMRLYGARWELQAIAARFTMSPAAAGDMVYRLCGFSRERARQLVLARSRPPAPSTTVDAPRAPARNRVEGSPLSGRELQVVRLIADGLTAREIAARLGVRLSTVNGLTERAFARLNVHNRTDAATEARRLGILYPGTPARVEAPSTHAGGRRLEQASRAALLDTLATTRAGA